MLVLNDKSLLRVVYNTVMLVDALVSFSPSNIPYIFLNEYNIGMLKFTVEINDMPNIIVNHVDSNENIELNQINDCSLTNSFKSEYYDLKYVSRI